MTEKLQLSKSDRQKVWWRSTFLQGSWNYERMQNLGWAYSLIPAIKNSTQRKKTKRLLLSVTWNSLTLTHTLPLLSSG